MSFSFEVTILLSELCFTKPLSFCLQILQRLLLGINLMITTEGKIMTWDQDKQVCQQC